MKFTKLPLSKQTHRAAAIAAVVVLAALGANPPTASAITCGFGTDIGGGVCRGYLTSGTSWTVPSDWNSSNNTIEVIGGGGGGASATAATSGRAGGGGAYSKATNVSLTPGASVAYVVGTAGTAGSGSGGSGGTGGDTYFCNSTSNCASISGTAVQAGAKGGGGGTTATAGAGGSSASGVGGTKFSGGTSSNNPRSAGAGAAGPSGAGAAGGDAGGATAGGGGGGNGGGAVGSNAVTTTGGAGGNNISSSGSGAGGTTASPTANAGTAGTSGGGGGGGGGINATLSNVGCGTFTGGAGGVGGAGTEWNTTHGSGGGGGSGGGVGISSNSGTCNLTGGNGANGGLYGGGGGAGGAVGCFVNGSGVCGTLTGGTSGGAGAQGIIVITYTPPVVVPSVSTNFAESFTPNTATLFGSITAAGGADATQSGFAWSTVSTLASNVSTTTLGAQTGTASFNSALSGLSANTTYYFRAYATNSGGTGYGSIQSFASDANRQGQLSGYAWSDNIGWISFINSVVAVNNDNTLAGYAWSDNIGWISFNSRDVAACGSTATLVDGALSGWAKALAADNNGWDGCIKLGDSALGYGPALPGGANASGTFTGYAWGSDIVGWIDFSQVTFIEDAAPACTLSGPASSVTPGAAFTLTWMSANSPTSGSVVQGATTVISNPTLPDGSGSVTAPSTSGTYLYTMSVSNGSTGTCNTSVDVGTAQPSIGSGDFYSNPPRVRAGKTTMLYWTVSNPPAQCSIVGTNGFNANINPTDGVQGSIATNAITTNTNFTLTCGSASATTNVGVVPQIKEI
ncbi:MAG: hypothetical protein KGH79_03935 [Patescibacteria group bacterium]|nr:hypothetical protein [Patescibacteria group bacterium]